MLPLILDKAGFNPKISHFFSNYLVGRKTKYLWNDFSSFFDVNVGIGQGSVLFFILLALYLSLVFHIFEKRVKNPKIPVFVLSFVNDGLFITQNKSLHISNSNLFCSYYIMSLLLGQFGLFIKYRKTEVFHFSRLQGVFNPPPLNLSILGGPILYSNVICQIHLSGKHISVVYFLPTIKACLSCNMSYSGVTTIWVFCLPWQRYFYSTQSSMMELLLSVYQY